jgi:hypothetical protein
MPLSLT